MRSLKGFEPASFSTQLLEDLAPYRAADEGSALWTPNPGPQTVAYESRADETAYGGAAGGGKTDLVLGLAFTRHRRSIIFRREYPQLKGIIERSKEIVGPAGAFNANDNVWRLHDGRQVEFGAVQHEDSKQKYQGRAHDLKGFDELVHFSRDQYRFLIAWNRTTDAAQRCRVVAAFNPPTPGQGDWVIQEWAPWLDPHYPHPAASGELRWYAMLDGELAWVASGEPFERDGKMVRPRSRTFIRARVEDNPALMASGYDAVLDNLPEPLRSQLRFGDFNAGAADHAWQTIPTRWVQLAQQRWRERAGPDVRLATLGVDVARGGDDQTVLSPRYGNWFAALQKHPGKSTPHGGSVAALVIAALASETAPVNIDCLAVGTSPLDILRANNVAVEPINFGAGAVDARGKPLTDKSGRYRFRNVRSAAYWKLREALDPASGEAIALPDDRELLGDLCAARYTVTAYGIQVESKEEIRGRIGRSTDCGDAVLLAHWQPPRNPLLGALGQGSARGWTPKV